MNDKKLCINCTHHYRTMAADEMGCYSLKYFCYRPIGLSLVDGQEIKLKDSCENQRSEDPSGINCGAIGRHWKSAKS